MGMSQEETDYLMHSRRSSWLFLLTSNDDGIHAALK
jgi:hypothetical protein